MMLNLPCFMQKNFRQFEYAYHPSFDDFCSDSYDPDSIKNLYLLEINSPIDGTSSASFALACRSAIFFLGCSSAANDAAFQSRCIPTTAESVSACSCCRYCLEANRLLVFLTTPETILTLTNFGYVASFGTLEASSLFRQIHFPFFRRLNQKTFISSVVSIAEDTPLNLHFSQK